MFLLRKSYKTYLFQPNFLDFEGKVPVRKQDESYKEYMKEGVFIINLCNSNQDVHRAYEDEISFFMTTYLVD
mgnify:CR=1 FL=1